MNCAQCSTPIAGLADHCPGGVCRTCHNANGTAEAARLASVATALGVTPDKVTPAALEKARGALGVPTWGEVAPLVTDMAGGKIPDAAKLASARAAARS